MKGKTYLTRKKKKAEPEARLDPSEQKDRIACQKSKKGGYTRESDNSYGKK